MFEKCDLCGLKMMPLKLKNDNTAIDYCPRCDRDDIPEKYQDKTYFQISLIEFKEALSERFKPIINWLNKNNIGIEHIIMGLLFILVCVFAIENIVYKHINTNLKNDNIQLFKANESLLESNNLYLNLNRDLIFRLWQIETDSNYKACLEEYLLLKAERVDGYVIKPFTMGYKYNDTTITIKIEDSI